MEIETIEKTLRPEYYCNQLSKSKSYVGLTPTQVCALTMVIDDSYLSEWELFKFKRLFWESVRNKYIFGGLAVGVGYYSTPYIFGILNVEKAYWRHLKLYTALAVGYVVYREFNIRTIPSRHFHDIITQEEPKGKYLRTVMKETHPRKWSIISKQLADMGYNFKEMNEYSQKETMPHPNNKFDNSLRI